MCTSLKGFQWNLALLETNAKEIFFSHLMLLPFYFSSWNPTFQPKCSFAFVFPSHWNTLLLLHIDSTTYLTYLSPVCELFSERPIFCKQFCFLSTLLQTGVNYKNRWIVRTHWIMPAFCSKIVSFKPQIIVPFIIIKSIKCSILLLLSRKPVSFEP